MTILHPWALAAGAAAVTLPLAIHWLTRPRPVRRPLSTIRFVVQAVRQRRARMRLRDVIVLALRIIAVLLLALAFARPSSRGKEAIAAEAGADMVRIVILDQSASMAAQSGGIASIDRARPVAALWLDGNGARGALIFAAARARTVFDRPTANWSALRDELAAAKALPERLNLSSAINLAADLLSKGGHGVKHEVVIVSDFQRSNWAMADLSTLPKDTVLHLESAAAKQTPGNVGILAVRGQGRIEQGREFRLEVDVGNYAATPREVSVDVRAGDATAQLKGVCPPGVVTTLSTPMIASGLGWESGEAKLNGVDDALAWDNTRPFALEVKAVATYLLISREPATASLNSSNLLERALAPSVSRSAASEKVVRVTPETLDRDAVGSAALVILDHPGPLSPANVALLVGEMRRGKSVWYVAAEPVDATNLKRIADAAGSDLKLPVEFYPPPAGEVRTGLFLADVKADRAPFAVFGDSLSAATGHLRFSGGLDSRASPVNSGALADDVLATYSDRSAALVVTNCGAGMLAVLNADLSLSTLPRTGVFVPLVDELADLLMGHRGIDSAKPPGEAAVWLLPASAGRAEGLTINGPSAGQSDLGSVSDDQNAVVWRWPQPSGPGVFTIRRGSATVFAVATAVPAEESDLTTIDPEVLTKRLAGGREVNFRAAGDDEIEDAPNRDRTWAWLAAACVGCVIVELGVLRGFKS